MLHQSLCSNLGISADLTTLRTADHWLSCVPLADILWTVCSLGLCVYLRAGDTTERSEGERERELKEMNGRAELSDGTHCELGEGHSSSLPALLVNAVKVGIPLMYQSSTKAISCEGSRLLWQQLVWQNACCDNFHIPWQCQDKREALYLRLGACCTSEYYPWHMAPLWITGGTVKIPKWSHGKRCLIDSQCHVVIFILAL